MSRKSTEPYLSTYLHSRGRGLGLPIAGNFELTARCNFDCPMCYVHLSQTDVDAAGRELTAAQWIGLARQARDKGMIFALLTGGEPFVRKDFFEIYDAMRQMGLMISINSNGSMLDGEIRRRLIENPPFRMNISLYGGCRETYRGMCGQDAFERVVENIRVLKEAGIDVNLNLSITPYNRQDLARIYEIACELDVNVKATSYMYPPIRVNGQQFGCGNRLDAEEAARCMVQWDLLRLDPEEFDRRADAMLALTLDEEGSCATELSEGVSCRAGSTSFWMTWDGRMLPCGMMPGPEFRPLEIGFDAAWNGIREETQKIRTPAECAACPSRKICGVCAAMCVTETGAFHEVPRYMCRKTQAQVRMMDEARRERKGV